MNNIKLAFISGGKRMQYCADELEKYGAECALFGFDTIIAKSRATRCTNLESCLGGSSAVILPTPLSRDGMTVYGSSPAIRLCDLFACIPKEVPVFAGAVSEKARSIARSCDMEIFDYLDNEELTEKNALATAEGAIYLMMRNSDKTIRGSKCLISGYGRIGRYTAKLLVSLGADVCVTARRSISRTQAELEGCHTVTQDLLHKEINTYDFIINTVPAQIYTETELSKMSSEQVYIELASAPYGLDKRIAEKYNIEITDGSALPSRYCPETAGKFIAETLREELTKGGIL